MEDISKYVNNAIELANILTAAKSIEVAEGFENDKSEPLKPYDCLESFLDSPLYDEKDSDIKKIFAAALAIGKSTGVVNVENAAKAEAIATVADDLLTRMKVAQQMENGAIDAIDATDVLVDATLARAQVGIDIAIDTYGPTVAQNLLLLNPVTAPLSPFVPKVMPFIAPKVKSVVHKGINFLREKAKPLLKKAAIKAVKEITEIVICK